MSQARCRLFMLIRLAVLPNACTLVRVQASLPGISLCVVDSTQPVARHRVHSSTSQITILEGTAALPRIGSQPAAAWPQAASTADSASIRLPC